MKKSNILIHALACLGVLVLSSCIRESRGLEYYIDGVVFAYPAVSVESGVLVKESRAFEYRDDYDILVCDCDRVESGSGARKEVRTSAVFVQSVLNSLYDAGSTDRWDPAYYRYRFEAPEDGRLEYVHWYFNPGEGRVR